MADVDDAAWHDLRYYLAYLRTYLVIEAMAKNIGRSIEAGVISVANAGLINLSA